MTLVIFSSFSNSATLGIEPPERMYTVSLCRTSCMASADACTNLLSVETTHGSATLHCLTLIVTPFGVFFFTKSVYFFQMSSGFWSGTRRIEARLGEGRAFGQKAIPRMDGLAARALGRGHELLDVEIRIGGRRRADRHRGIRVADVRSESVGVGVHSHGLHSFLVACAYYANRDLAAVRNQHALQRHPSSVASPKVSNALQSAGTFVAARR